MLFVDFLWSKEMEEEEDQGQGWRRWEKGGGDSAPIQAGAIWPENELFLLFPENEEEEVWKVFLRRRAQKRSLELRRRLQQEGAAKMLPAHGGKRVGGGGWTKKGDFIRLVCLFACRLRKNYRLRLLLPLIQN